MRVKLGKNVLEARLSHEVNTSLEKSWNWIVVVKYFFVGKTYGKIYCFLLFCYSKKLIFHRRCRFTHLYQVLLVKHSLPGKNHKEVCHKSLHSFLVSCNYLQESFFVGQSFVLNRLKHIFVSTEFPLIEILWIFIKMHFFQHIVPVSNLRDTNYTSLMDLYEAAALEKLLETSVW